MKAVAVLPGRPNSVHLATLPTPSVGDIPGGRGVVVRVLRVGVDGTDKEINAAEYGAAPPGYDFLTIGHESFGVVEEVGPNVTEVKRGDLVVATVRRPGSSIYDLIGTNDMTTDDVYYERGINLRHGFLTEHYVDDVEYIVRLPQGLREVGVLLEPMTVVQKGVHQAYEIQRRLRVWRPRRAAVMGAGTIGLLATLVLRLRGIDVTTFARSAKPNLNADLIESLGARYVTTADMPIVEGGGSAGEKLATGCHGRFSAGSHPANSSRHCVKAQRTFGQACRYGRQHRGAFATITGWPCLCGPSSPTMSKR